MTGSLIQKLVERFMKFPGIGPRQAKRFVYYLLALDQPTIKQLADELVALKEQTDQCQNCYRFYPRPAANSQNRRCDLCRDDQRDQRLLMLVEKDIDLANIEKTGTYQGNYFVLGGLVPILSENPEQNLRAEALKREATRRIQSGALAEIIIALATTIEGDHTASYLKKLLAAELGQHQLRLTVLGRGLSSGAELEYSDTETLKQALKNRA